MARRPGVCDQVPVQSAPCEATDAVLPGSHLRAVQVLKVENAAVTVKEATRNLGAYRAMGVPLVVAGLVGRRLGAHASMVTLEFPHVARIVQSGPKRG